MLGFGTELNNYSRSLIRILYPPYCVLCHAYLKLEETYLCAPCVQLIQPLKAPLCLKCSEPLPPYGKNQSVCSTCRSERPYYNRGFALLRYEDPIKTIFHQVKFQKKLWLREIFSKLIASFSSSINPNDYEMIVPVPLDARRERERGFNQALLIAKMLERSFQKDRLRISALIAKKKKVLPQSQLKRRERLENLEGAFCLKKRGQSLGKRILLVDDIVTTGSTINECAKILKEDGAECVDFFVLPRS